MSRRTAQPEKVKTKQLLYNLRVTILSGPIVTRKNDVIARTIQIRGDQTLEQLHGAIFGAFDREDEHMYEFQFCRKPHDPDGKRYVLPMEQEDPYPMDSQPDGDVTRTTIGSLGLSVNQSFLYWFDFGDDWWHQIDVVSVSDQVPKGKYPRITERAGDSPPQYADCDEEDEDSEEEDDEDE